MGSLSILRFYHENAFLPFSFENFAFLALLGHPPPRFTSPVYQKPQNDLYSSCYFDLSKIFEALQPTVVRARCVDGGSKKGCRGSSRDIFAARGAGFSLLYTFETRKPD